MSITLVLFAIGFVASTGGVAAETTDSVGSTAHSEIEITSPNATATTNGTVAGTTELAPGTELRVIVASDRGVEPGFISSRVVRVRENGTFRATFDFSDDDPGDSYEIEVEAINRSDAATTAEGVLRAGTTPTPTREERVIRITSPNATAATDGTVVGEANLSAGARLRVVVETDDGVSPQFLLSETATVRENGTFQATFDFSSNDPGDSYEIEVEAINRSDAATTAEGVLRAGTTPTPTREERAIRITSSNATATTGGVVAGETNLSAGARLRVVVETDDGVSPQFLLSETATVRENGTFQATFDFSSNDPGDSYEVTVQTQADDAPDVRQTAEGTLQPPETETPREAATESETPAVTDTRTPTDTETPTVTNTETQTVTEPEPQTTTTDTPGFTAVVGVVALSVASVALRRR